MMAINLSAQRNMTIVLPKHTSKTMQTIKIQQPTMNSSSKPKKRPNRRTSTVLRTKNNLQFLQPVFLLLFMPIFLSFHCNPEMFIWDTFCFMQQYSMTFGATTCICMDIL